jgi:2-oxoglutarate dehydrogenase E1 component
LSGKAYYDMVNERAAKKRTDIAFVRVEELNPFPAAELKRELQKFSAAQG